MPTYVHLHRQALSSWVFEDARRWHLFCYLLMKADQQGRTEVSVKEYAETFGIPRTTCRRIIDEMKERGMVETKTATKRPYLTICKYEYYNTLTAEKWPQNGHPREEKEGERESNVSPTPLSYKEKEEEREEALKKEYTRTRESEIKEINTDTSELDGYLKRMRGSAVWLESVAMKERTSAEEVLARLDEFRLECLAAGKLHHNDMREVQYHFTNWLRVKRQKEKEYEERKKTAEGRYVDPGDRRRAERQRNLQEAAAAAAAFRSQAYAAALRL